MEVEVEPVNQPEEEVSAAVLMQKRIDAIRAKRKAKIGELVAEEKAEDAELEEKAKKREEARQALKIDEEKRLLFASVAADTERKKSRRKIDWKAIKKPTSVSNKPPPKDIPEEDESRHFDSSNR